MNITFFRNRSNILRSLPQGDKSHTLDFIYIILLPWHWQAGQFPLLSKLPQREASLVTTFKLPVVRNVLQKNLHCNKYKLKTVAKVSYRNTLTVKQEKNPNCLAFRTQLFKLVLIDWFIRCTEVLLRGWGLLSTRIGTLSTDLEHISKATIQIKDIPSQANPIT